MVEGKNSSEKSHKNLNRMRGEKNCYFWLFFIALQASTVRIELEKKKKSWQEEKNLSTN